ncbi:MAG: serine/threonine protein kinase [Thermoprotei archaeon]
MAELSPIAARVVGYPCAPTPKILLELEELGVELVECGNTLLNGVRVLGKGTRGVVVGGVFRGVNVAVKLRRCDSPRLNMLHEAEMLRLANSVNVGPKLIYASENLIVMELVEGVPLKRHTLIGDRDLASCVLDALHQASRLDSLGLDHGELSRAHSHIYCSAGNSIIIDFDSASTARKPHNYNSLKSYFFMGRGELQRRVRTLFTQQAYTQKGIIPPIQPDLEK